MIFRRFPYTTLNDINLDWIIKQVKQIATALLSKQDKPELPGVSGQVLGLDDNLDPVWVDQGGGGGGTTNYNSLSNKPQINGVTLSDNKTAADLGLAAASDIPAVPVQSVNGQTGAVELDAADVGALPSTTTIPTGSLALPLMDGTASAGANLTRFAMEGHVHPTDTSRASAAELATFTRPNLLDNWYFVGGGSQLGYGTFPINQRGQTSYSNAGHTIDRWRTDGSLIVNAGGINTGGTVFYQLLSAAVAKKLLGKTVTASALLADGTLLSGTATFPSSISATSVIAYPGTNNKLRYALFNDGNIQILRFHLTSTDADIVAAKVEIGSSQTLAHQEGSSWVLNELPDYGEQLLRCQHYAMLLPGTSVFNGYSNSETIIRIAVPCPAQFAGVPSIEYGGTGFSYLRLIGNGVALSPTSATASLAGNEIVLEFTVSGATQNMPYALKNNGVSIIIFVN